MPRSSTQGEEIRPEDTLMAVTLDAERCFEVRGDGVITILDCEKMIVALHTQIDSSRVIFALIQRIVDLEEECYDLKGRIDYWPAENGTHKV